MKIWEVKVNTTGNAYSSRSEHMVTAPNSVKAIQKAVTLARKQDKYRNLDATEVRLIGEAK